MSNAQFDQLINAIEGQAVPLIILVVILIGLLAVFLKWFENWLTRMIRSAKAPRLPRGK